MLRASIERPFAPTSLLLAQPEIAQVVPKLPSMKYKALSASVNLFTAKTVKRSQTIINYICCARKFGLENYQIAL
jgi:hypothetical protein